MSTRGILGFLADGKLTVTYNHSDSYPAGLGSNVAEFVAGLATAKAIAKAKKQATSLRVVKEGDKPTEQEKKDLAKFADLGVSSGTLDEWYCLLRKSQGDIPAMFEAGVMIDGLAFAASSLFCEWGYVVNFDTKKVEVYRGFQSEPHAKGRFATLPIEKERLGTQYYPIALLMEFPFESVVKDMAMLEDN